MEAERTRRRGLTRAAVVARALELGGQEGLDAVSLRRLAADLNVTPMALYRHVKDKQDLINAMTESVLEDLDLTAGINPSLPWTERIRRAMTNFKEQMDARPLALPLSIAYTGDGPSSFWRMSEALLGILLEAGFSRREAVVLIRVVSNLLAGHLLLFRQEDRPVEERFSPEELELVRKRVELSQLSLPRDEFPNLVASAREMAEVWISHPDRWWRQTVDLIIAGLEARQPRASTPKRRGRKKP